MPTPCEIALDNLNAHELSHPYRYTDGIDPVLQLHYKYFKIDLEAIKVSCTAISGRYDDLAQQCRKNKNTCEEYRGRVSSLRGICKVLVHIARSAKKGEEPKLEEIVRSYRKLIEGDGQEFYKNTDSDDQRTMTKTMVDVYIKLINSIMLFFVEHEISEAIKRNIVR